MSQQLVVPAPPVLRAEFTELEELCAAVRSWDLFFQPLSRPAPCDTIGRIVQQRLGPAEIAYARFLASIEQKGAPPSGCLTFGVPEARMRRLWWRGRDVDAGTVLVFPVGCELSSFSGPDFEIHTISLTGEGVAGVCERFKQSLPPARRRPETFCPPPALLAALRSGLRRIRDRTGGDCNLEATQLIESLVLAWLASAPAGREHRQPARVRDRAIRRCLERIEQADWAELSPGLLCEIGGVSERTLQYAFRERFNLAPAGFLKARRLAAVREALLRSEASELQVGDVAASFGFWHVGQFAADYRRTFGETPSWTLKRSRDG
jgi:AraC family ethanolamine operon transcriptional activator